MIRKISSIVVVTICLILVSGTVWATPLPTNIVQLERLARAGDMKAMNNLGVIYFNGNKVTQDLKEASNWLKQSAEKGYEEGQYNLGMLHYYKLKQQLKVNETIEWVSKEAEMYWFKNEITETLKWFEKAAKQGEIKSMEKLSKIYRDGIFVVQNIDLADEWEKKSKDVK